MKKSKIIIVLFFIILLTGCSGTYNIKINENLSVDETVDLTIPSSGDAYEKTNKLFSDNGIDNKKYDIVASDNNVKITYKEKYDSIEDYLVNSKLYKNFFERVDYENDRNTIKLSTKSVFKFNEVESDNIVDNYNVSLLQINVESPLKMVSNNADNKSDNIYSWILNKNTTNKSIVFTLDVKNKSNSYISIVVLSLIGLIVISTVIVIISRFKRGQKM